MMIWGHYSDEDIQQLAIERLKQDSVVITPENIAKKVASLNRMRALMTQYMNRSLQSASRSDADLWKEVDAAFSRPYSVIRDRYTRQEYFNRLQNDRYSDYLNLKTRTPEEQKWLSDYTFRGLEGSVAKSEKGNLFALIVFVLFILLCCVILIFGGFWFFGKGCSILGIISWAIGAFLLYSLKKGLFK